MTPKLDTAIARARLSTLTRQGVQDALARFRESGSSLQTCNHYRAALRAFSNWCYKSVRTREDGWIEVRVPWSPGEGLVAWILSFGPDAEAVEPPELRSEILGRLEAIVAS